MVKVRVERYINHRNQIIINQIFYFIFSGFKNSVGTDNIKKSKFEKKLFRVS